ncbi:MAG: ATP-binding protein [Anaerolineales bacterium]
MPRQPFKRAYWAQVLLPAGVAAVSAWGLALYAGLPPAKQCFAALGSGLLVGLSSGSQAQRTWQPLLDLWPRVQKMSGEAQHSLAHVISHLIQRIEWLESRQGDEAQRLNALLAQISDGVLVIGERDTVQGCNPGAARLFGVHREQAIHMSLTALVRDHRIVKLWQESHTRGTRLRDEITLAGSERVLRITAAPLAGSGGAAGLLLLHDLTHARRLERARRDLVSNISHELRTPLASIRALSDTLQEGALDDPPAARHFLGLMQIEVDALAQMVSELVELSHIESGNIPIARHACAPAVLLQTAQERLAIQAERKGVRLRVEPCSTLPPVLADATRIEQVLVNLIHNALKFTPPGGEVVLSAEAAADGMVRFCVADTGSGIPAEALPRIFERFYKADPSRSQDGTGLGLAICRHLVAAHEGKIWAESVEGQGSRFYFALPQV